MRRVALCDEGGLAKADQMGRRRLPFFNSSTGPMLGLGQQLDGIDEGELQ